MKMDNILFEEGEKFGKLVKQKQLTLEMWRVLYLLLKFEEEEATYIWNGKRNSLYQQDQNKTEEKEHALQKTLNKERTLWEREILPIQRKGKPLDSMKKFNGDTYIEYQSIYFT